MATQTIEFEASTGETITARLYSLGSDTIAATASSVTERTNAKGVYDAVFTTTLSGVYRLTATDPSNVPLASWFVRIENADGTYVSGSTASPTQTFPSNFQTLGINASGHISRVVLVDTTTTNLDMRGTDGAALAAHYTASRGLYLDNLNIGGQVASQSDINALNQSASRRIIINATQQLERPEAGTTSYEIEARTFDGDGASVNADSTPTLTATGIISGSLNANLSSPTNPTTGTYRWTYSVANNATQEQIRFDLSATISSSTFTISTYSAVVDSVSTTWNTTDATRLAAIYNKLPSRSYMTGATSSAGELVPGDILNQMPSGGWTEGSFGNRLVISADVNRTIGITALNRVPADVVAIQPGAINPDSITDPAVTKIQSGLSTLTQSNVRSAVGLASANLDTQISNVQSGINTIQGRIPDALIGGRMNAHVGVIGNDTIGSDAIATSAVNKLQNGISTLTASEVKDQILDVLENELFEELDSVPGATSSLKDKIAFVFMMARNKMTQSSNAKTLYADDNTTAVSTSTVSDDGTLFTKNKET